MQFYKVDGFIIYPVFACWEYLETLPYPLVHSDWLIIAIFAVSWVEFSTLHLRFQCA